VTYQATACPSCASPSLTSRPALMAPFIARYVLGRPPEICDLCSCDDCGLMFFRTRYDDAEIVRLYAGYREERYLAVRHGFEPWYTRKFNDDIGSPVGVAPRQQGYRAALTAHTDVGTIGSVLDYAGDQGQLMAGGPGRELFVFDISGATPVEGVIGIADEGDLDDRVFDVVLMCEIVEHFSEPSAQVKRVAKYVRPGGLLYIEVPDEQFRLEAIPRAPWYAAYLRRLARGRLGLLLLDFWSTGFRVKFRAIPPLGFAKQHEHLNYFDVKSLTHLVLGAGLEVLECSTARTTGAVVALCRKGAEADVVAGGS